MGEYIMVFKKVLLLYKRSAYNIYFLDKENSFVKGRHLTVSKEINRFKKAHDEHYKTLQTLESILSDFKIDFDKKDRGKDIHYDQYDLVITVGGDGTFLEAAKGISRSVLLGVNSAPSYSVGNLCAADAKNFRWVLEQILKDGYKPMLLPRLKVEIDGIKNPVYALNDILVCHKNPAAMSRYYLKIGRRKEEQRSSGIWLAAPAGSSGAVHSAGGRVMARDQKVIQYMPRELYTGGHWKYLLNGGILNKRQTVSIISLMRKGMIYVDGTHTEFNFSYGAKIKIGLAPTLIKVVSI